MNDQRFRKAGEVDRRQLFGSFIPFMKKRPKGDVRITQKSGCLLCGACVRGCCTGALNFEDRDEIRAKRWDAKLCGHCGQCVARCPDSLLVFEVIDEDNLNLPGQIELHRFRYRRCPECGTIVREEDGPLCLPCKRRGAFYWPINEGAETT